MLSVPLFEIEAFRCLVKTIYINTMIYLTKIMIIQRGKNMWGGWLLDERLKI
jgi:hypothetical protein